MATMNGANGGTNVGTNGKRPNIVVLGGGFGGLESAFYLRWKLKDQADITLVSDRDYFLCKPNTIYIPFSLDPDKLNKATFTQAPLRLTGVPEKPVEVEPSAMDDYKLGSSSVRRLGKKALSYYLPFRFAGGNPFHVGVPWKGMEVGLKVMSKVMAK